MLRLGRTTRLHTACAAATLAGALAASGCGSCDGSPPAPWTDDGSPVEAPRFGRSRAHLDLLELRHLADVEHDGLYVDFGTPARAKYTIGDWRTGFGRDAREGATTFSPIESDAARIYFPVDRVGELTLRIRARASRSTRAQAYLNDTLLPSPRLEAGADFRDYDLAVPARAVVRGENYLRLRLETTGVYSSSTLGLALDSLRVIPGPADPGETFTPPEHGSLVARVSLGGARRRALAVRVPTTLSWYVEVPPGGTLALGVGGDVGSSGATSATVTVTPEGGRPAQLFARPVTDRWQDATLQLERWAGQVVRLDLRAAGPSRDARVAWSTPTVLVPPTASASPPRRAKNVVLVLIDTIRADHVRSFDERTVVQTPAMDRLAREGTVFTQAQAPESWTKPSVSSILTGLWPMTHHVKTGDARLPAGATLLSEMVRAAGLETAAFIANTFISDRYGFDRGWGSFRNDATDDRPTTAQAVLGEAGDWIEQHAHERFFVYVHTIDPHAPYDPPGEFAEMYDPRPYRGRVLPARTAQLVEQLQRDPIAVALDESDRRRLAALYDGELSYHDHYLGELIARLERIGVLDDTLFVVVGDHGEELGDHASYGHAHTVYQELLHVPLVLRLPGTFRAGQRVDTTVSAMDALPTILDALGVEVPRTVEARSLVGLARGELPAGPAVAFSELGEEHRVVRAGRWKLALRGVAPTLFDLERDPREQHPLPLASRPIALRYCRILLGQFLGTRNRREWSSAVPSAPGLELESENVAADAEQCRRLAALGYANRGCPPLPPPLPPSP